MLSLIHDLRSLVPKRPLTFNESFRLAELQAFKLLAVSGITTAPIPDALIANLPHIEVMRVSPLPASVSGGTKWIKGSWLIVLNAAEPLVRQRFSLMHEFKHVLDGKNADMHYPAVNGMTSADRAEQVCDFFAACLLMPKAWVRRAYVNGVQDPKSLARMFFVSTSAMSVRLQSLGLATRTSRHPIIERVAA